MERWRGWGEKSPDYSSVTRFESLQRNLLPSGRLVAAIATLYPGGGRLQDEQIL